MIKYTENEALEACLVYFDGDELAANVFLSKYALRDNNGALLEKTPTDMHHRLAKEFARIEAKYPNPLSEGEIFSYLDKFKYIVPQGSPMFGIGNPYQITSYSNCYVLPSPFDSYGGIMHTDQESAHIYRRRGGVGFDISTIRPKGMPTANAAKTTDGIGVFMERYSNTCREVAQNGRRGALMLTCSVHHPEIETFVDIKQDKTKVTGANVSVFCTDEFMDAVRDDTEYEQRWPVDAEEPTLRKMVRARDVWNKIIHCAWASAEPGVLFQTTIKRETPTDVYWEEGFATTSTNPCSEITLSPYDSCRLMVVNLLSFVKDPYTSNAAFDYDEYERVVIVAQRLMDDLIDLELEVLDNIIAKIDSDPEPNHIKSIEIDLWKNVKKACQDGRRTGLGITALGDTIAALNICYGSAESIKTTEELYKNLAVSSYISSIHLAEERGAFPIFNLDKDLKSPFINRVMDQIKGKNTLLFDKYCKTGRRNIANTTTAPTGSVSILTQTTSGIEPAFLLKYDRFKKINPSDPESKVDRVDALGDSWQKFTVYHHGFKRWMDATGKTEIKDSPYNGATSSEIDWVASVDIQSVAQRWIDHAISKCVAAGESLVLTNRGMLDIEEIAEIANGVNVGEFSDIDLKVINRDKNITNSPQVYFNGLADCLKITLNNKSAITCTKDHKLLTIGEHYNLVWKHASDINEGDYILSLKGMNLWNSGHINLENIIGKPFNYDRKYSKDVNIPKEMTLELAEFLGYMCSDGTIQEHSFGLTQLPNNIVPRFAELVEKLFGTNVSKTIDKRSDIGLASYRVNSSKIADFLRYLGLTKHDENMTVPKVVRCAGKRHVEKFIMGLTLDGHVVKNSSGAVVMTSCSYKFLEQVQQLMLNLDIDSNIVQASEKAWCLTILDSDQVARFIDIIGFAESEKIDNMKKYAKSTSRKLPLGSVPDFNLRVSFRNNVLPKIKSNKMYEYFSSLTSKDKQGREITRESILEMIDVGLNVPEFLTDSNYIVRKVSSIDDVGSKKTYDISVPETNSYIVNGIVSHNTCNLPKDTTEELVDQVYMKAWETGCKGFTIYRDGCRDGVLVSSEEDKEEVISERSAPTRPKTLRSETHKIKIDTGEGIKNAYITVSFYPETNKPYEVFINTPIGQSLKDLQILELSARMTSLALRHGIPVEFITNQLAKIDGQYIYSIPTNLAKALSPYIKETELIDMELDDSYVPEEVEKKINSNVGNKVSECPGCGKQSYVKQEGCGLCLECGFSSCS